jgi:hypothetical protein
MVLRRVNLNAKGLVDVQKLARVFMERPNPSYAFATSK